MAFLLLLGLLIPAFSYTPTYCSAQTSEYILDLSTFTLTDLFAFLSNCNAEHTGMIIHNTKVDSKRLTEHLSEKLQRANGVWNMGSFMGYCNYATHLENRVLYTVLYKKAKKLLAKSGSLAQKQAFQSLPNPTEFEQLTGTAEYHTGWSLPGLIKKATAHLTLRETLAYLLVSSSYRFKSPTRKRAAEKKHIPDTVDTYKLVYEHARELCKTDGTAEQKDLFPLFYTPEEYKIISTKTDAIKLSLLH